MIVKVGRKSGLDAPALSCREFRSIRGRNLRQPQPSADRIGGLPLRYEPQGDIRQKNLCWQLAQL